MRKFCLLLSVLLALVLCACGQSSPAAEPTPVPVIESAPTPTPEPVTSLDLSEEPPEAAEGIQWTEDLRFVDLGEDSYKAWEVEKMCREHPEVEIAYAFHLDSERFTLADTSVDLSQRQDLAGALLEWLPMMKNLTEVELGSGDYRQRNGLEDSPLDFRTIRAMEDAAPQAHFSYAFTFYGKDFTLDSTFMDMNHIAMDDEGELVQAIALCMPELSYLDMDFCEVSDERMAEIRDSLPNADVVWRIWFGKGREGGYTARTDVEKILASNPDKCGELNKATTEALKYCTKVKYLDLGHNDQLDDISFCAYMPDLEVLVLAMGGFHDLSPLANCPKLEYLEIQTSGVSDLRPLSGLKNLRHLNICYNFTLMDITPLYELTELERLYIGIYDPVPPEQIEEMQRRAPQCKIVTDIEDPVDGGWRYVAYDALGGGIADPRYALLREQFGYGSAPYCYAYIENDPLYYPHGQN